ncbi:MAG: hypothetical protein QOE63_137 [Acidimicrobiaceae bacterium]
MPTFQHDGLQLHYTDQGEGPVVLCVHGATGTGSNEWSRLASALGDRYRFVLPDLRGHGSSDDCLPEISIEHVDADLVALIAHAALPAPHVIGFSFGAEAVLDLELHRPGTVSSLVLISPGLNNPNLRVPTRAELESTWPASLRGLHRARHGPDQWLNIMFELCARAQQRPAPDPAALAALGCPILLVVGSADDRRRVRQAHQLAELNERCRLVVVDGAHHAVHKERPPEVAAAVGEFLDFVNEAARP